MGGNHYEILGVSPTASDHEIRDAYLRLARKHHPDQNDATDSGSRFRQISNAYGVLSNPTKRREYDELLQREQNKRDSQTDPDSAANAASDMNQDASECAGPASRGVLPTR